MGERIVQRRLLPFILMAASGFAGLGYQVVWTQQAALWQGHESAAVLAVVAAFFGGLSLGSFVLGTRVEQSSRAVRWYAVCESVIAAWSLVLRLIMPSFSGFMLQSTGAAPSPLWQWSLAFSSTFALLLPATAAMGATLPAMERILERGDAQRVAALYASNTFGAVLGVLGTAFVLVPALGLSRTVVVCAVLNVFCAVASFTVFGDGALALPEERVGTGTSARGLLVSLALSGFLGIGYEVVVVRVLSQVSEGTVYTFAALLAVYLVGSAVGAAAYQRWIARRKASDELADALPALLATACLMGTATLWFADSLKSASQQSLGSSLLAAMASETLPALFAFGLPTLVMGALFSHLCRLALGSGVGFGRALAVNTLGAAVAPIVVGAVLVPWVGPKLSLLTIAFAYLLLVRRESWTTPKVYLPAGATLALWAFSPPLSFIDVPDGGRIVSYEDGAMAAVSVVEDAQGVLRLRINNRAQEGSSATQRVDGRQAWLPLLLHPAPQKALFLGLGTGITAASAAEDPTLSVDAVELLPEVVRASEKFAPSLAEGKPYARLHVLEADARRYVRASEQSYDVIVSDNFHPARSGSGSLYTVEHFEAVRHRLTPGGVFCQWLPLHQLDNDTLRNIVRSFLTAYPEGSALIASNSLETPVLGLVGRRDVGRFDFGSVRERLGRVALGERLTRIGLEDEFAVLGSFVAGARSLRSFSANAEANTDDRPIVAYRAPRVTYAPDSNPGERLIALLRELSVEPSQLLTPDADEGISRRLAAYWKARDRFIEFGRGVRPSSRAEDMLAQVREPLLSVLRISPDFRPAYDPLLSMAGALGRSDVDGARTLLAALARVQPARGEAGLLLTQMNSDASTLRAPTQ